MSPQLALVAAHDKELVPAAKTVCGVSRGDEVMRSMKAEHLKAQADECVRQGNYGVAAQRYTESMQLKPGGENDARLLSNRALALHKAGRHSAAAEDAARACSLAPEWGKAWFRLGTARGSLGDAPGAVAAFTRGLRVQPGCCELRAALRAAVWRMTREQLAATLLRALDEAQERGCLVPPEVEDVTRAEKEEALFRHIHLFQRDKPKPGDYYAYLTLWSEAEWSAGMAYIHRSRMYALAKCYAQAAKDAEAAVKYFQSCTRALTMPGQRDPDALSMTHIYHPGTTSPFRRARIEPLAWAWFARGEAFTAEDSHPFRDWGAAAACYVRALDLDARHPTYAARLADAASELNQAQLSGVLDAVYISRDGAQGHAAAALGMANAPEGTTHRCFAALRFTQANPTDFSAKARDVFRIAIAAAADVQKTQVLIERVRPPSAVARDADSVPALEIQFYVNFGGSMERSQAFAAQCMAEPAEVVGSETASLIGAPDTVTASARSEAVTLEAHDPLDNAGARAIARAQNATRVRDIVVARPLKDMEMPYASYQLVRADGRRVERVDKHPFQLSRVFYEARERTEEVWAGMLDGSCRWRQSASEVGVIALRVPTAAPTCDLDVLIDLHRIRVASRLDGTVYLEGELERGIVPDESVWTWSAGSVGEDGFVFYLKKMNLELVVSGGDHSETWWPRLFKHHGEIAWDDYEKDYSDLPEAVMRDHALLEYKGAVTNRLEAAQKRERESAGERDDARRRARQERLHVLRGGAPLSWVELDRLNPAVDDMPSMPPSREGALLDVVRTGAAQRQAAVLAGALAR